MSTVVLTAMKEDMATSKTELQEACEICSLMHFESCLRFHSSTCRNAIDFDTSTAVLVLLWQLCIDHALSRGSSQHRKVRGRCEGRTALVSGILQKESHAGIHDLSCYLLGRSSVQDFKAPRWL
eukprot:1689618-Amphidinium_carterae.1